jgi:hypothetical protein
MPQATLRAVSGRLVANSMKCRAQPLQVPHLMARLEWTVLGRKTESKDTKRQTLESLPGVIGLQPDSRKTGLPPADE